jgi:OOP family OmpA-OmpF porin
MKPFLSTPAFLLTILFLTAGCSSVTVGPVIKKVKEGPPPANNYKEALDMELNTQDYSKWLQKDYKALTLFEYDEMFDYDSAERFAIKSAMAGAGNIPKPDAVTSRTIDATYQAEANAMYNSIQDAYARGKNYSNPKDMARLQVSYDCWLEQVEENIQPDHILKCKDFFYDSLSRLKDAPPPEPTPVPATLILYFDNNSDVLGEEEAQKLAEAVRSPLVAHTSIVIDGHADALDSPDHNLGLSERRADAVKRAILEQDPTIMNISIKAYGESEPSIPTPDGVAEPRNRRVVIYFN